MATPHDYNKAWERGYIDGYMRNRSTIPSIPSRPASYPPGVDPQDYYYKEGYAKGYKAGLQSAAGINKS